VEDCERAQTAWFRVRAETLGEIRTDGPLTWLRTPDTINLMFPTVLPADGLARAQGWARAAGLSIGVWLNLAADAQPLRDAGFERGWSPWWMTADLDTVAPPDDPRVELQEASDDYGPQHAAYGAEVALARLRPKQVWYTAAYAGGRRQFAGRAFAHRVDDVAGIFDMAVWPPFQRLGLGTALLRTVCAAAREAGATHAVLNATPEGKLLYDTCGFTQIGAGITWWWHPKAIR